MTEPDTCPICGEEYQERHEIEDYEKNLKDAGGVMEAITDDIHMVEVENRLLVFYVHTGALLLPGEGVE